MMGGMGSTIATGMALGAGSAVGHAVVGGAINSMTGGSGSGQQQQQQQQPAEMQGQQ